MKRLNITFSWQGITGRYGVWRDGLFAALKLIEQEHNVTYIEPSDEIPDTTDVLLYWEALCCQRGQDAENYYRMANWKGKKALLFAGGPILPQYDYGFDLYFVESKINEEEFEALGLPWKRAFGVNTQVMKPQKQPKIFDGMHQATCASWKRLDLFSQALGAKGVVCGRYQETDPQPYLDCRTNGTLLLPETTSEGVSALLNASETIVNTSSFWGGGQRAVLEGLACGIPAIVMNDSPKNSEYILESGAGLVVDPTPQAIQEAISIIKEWKPEKKTLGAAYIDSKWTERHYADALLEGIRQII